MRFKEEIKSKKTQFEFRWVKKRQRWVRNKALGDAEEMM